MRSECPTCGKKTEYRGNPFRPFCSERCKLIDLGKWASGTYRLPSQEKPLAESFDSEEENSAE